jgi:hypothetical protein
MCASVTFTNLATAHASTPDIMVLRSDLTDSPLGAVIDGELASGLIERAHFASSYFSPTPFGDIELAAGCHASTDACVERVAASLDADRLLVRELRRDATGALVLTLVAKDEASKVTRRAESVVTFRGEKRPELVVPQLIARVYAQSDAEPQLPQVPGPVPSHERLHKAGYAVLGGSVALLAAGVGVGVSSRRAHERYTDMQVNDAASAEAADAQLDDAQRRARTANILFATGAAAATTSLVMLLWGRFKDAEHQPRIAVGVEPVQQGGFVRVTGRLGRM